MPVKTSATPVGHVDEESVSAESLRWLKSELWHCRCAGQPASGLLDNALAAQRALFEARKVLLHFGGPVLHVGHGKLRRVSGVGAEFSSK